MARMVIEEIKRKDQVLPFVSSFANKYGYPKWANSLAINLENASSRTVDGEVVNTTLLYTLAQF